MTMTDFMSLHVNRRLESCAELRDTVRWLSEREDFGAVEIRCREIRVPRIDQGASDRQKVIVARSVFS